MMSRFARLTARTALVGALATLSTAGAAATTQDLDGDGNAARGVLARSAEAETVTFTPEADTYVAAVSPTRNYGNAPQLRVDSSTAKRMFLRFVVKGVTERITSATLRLHVADTPDGPSPDGGTFRHLDNISWGETVLTWNMQPSIVGKPVIGTAGPVQRNTWVEIDVSKEVTHGGRFSFAATSANSNFAEYDSRETAFAPQLVVTTGALPPPPPPDAEHVLVGVGDIASSSSGDTKTAALVTAVLAKTPEATVYTTGDNAYPDGRASDYADYYDPTWGVFKNRTRPSPGNHDYNSNGARGYYEYFGDLAGPAGQGYYSYDLGEWHIVSLNSERSMSAGSAQETWLLKDLAASSKPCTLAYWHRPLFTSGSNHGPYSAVRPLYKALYDHGAEVVVTGHNHNYERFAPMTPGGERDDARGIRHFVAGMGGKSHYGFGDVAPNSEARNSNTYGVLKFVLRPTGYDWEFIPEEGKSYTDSGSGTCH